MSRARRSTSRAGGCCARRVRASGRPPAGGRRARRPARPRHEHARGDDRLAQALTLRAPDEEGNAAERARLFALVGHVARRRDQHAVADRDLADEVLRRALLILGAVDHGRLVRKGNCLEEVSREEHARPRPGPVLVVVRSMLARSHRSPPCQGRRTLRPRADATALSRRGEHEQRGPRRRPLEAARSH